MSILTREEFKALVWDQIGDGGCGCGACSESIVAAHDAALARIAELERQLESVRKMLGNACEILGGEQCAVDGRLAYRARIAREFAHDVEGSVDRPQDEAPTIRSVYDVLARWEAAAKEGK